MPEPEKITEEQASEALRALVGQAAEPEEEASVRKEVLEEQPAEPAPEKPAPAGEPPEEAAPEAAVPEPSDDVVSLKKRLEEERSQYDARVKAMQDRYQHNEQIVRERFLRKATVADKALKVLRAVRTTDGGVPAEEVDRAIQEIEGTMNPASPSYQPPPAAVEDQALVLNAFLNEKGMTAADAESFGKWIRGEGGTALSPQEQSLAGRDLDGFLRLAHLRYEQARTKPATRDAAVEAVRSVQRTQREAARAATSTPAAPRKTGAAQAQGGIDLGKLTKDDISSLLRQSVEQSR